MLDASKNVLKLIEDCGFKAYIVGGFVRDYLLSKKSNDIDITTNATPRDVLKIFPNADISNEKLGVVTINYNDVRFEITTFRIEYDYVNNRRPSKVLYTDSLIEDLKRRDFTINAICMDNNENIIDPLNGRDDLKSHTLRCIGNANMKFQEDALRILRCIRFATSLNFNIDEEALNAIKENKDLLKNISYDVKRHELDKIFTSSNAIYGIKLILNLDLDKSLELNNLNKVTYTDSLMGVWAVIDTCKYHFTKIESQEIESIKTCLKLDNSDPYVLYKYGPYFNFVASSIKHDNINTDLLYKNLVIHSFSDIDISINDIVNIINNKDVFLSDVKADIEKQILYKSLTNNRKEIVKYIISNY